MVSMQLSQARAIAGLVAVSVVLTGCGMFGHGRDTSTPMPPTRTGGVSSDTAQAAPEEDLTATEAAIDTASAPAQAATPAPDASIIRPDAPKTYTVKPGDTPSAIAARLKIGVGELLDANPKADPNNLHPGQKLTIP
jgi:LysM repeat protein